MVSPKSSQGFKCWVGEMVKVQVYRVEINECSENGPEGFCYNRAAVNDPALHLCTEYTLYHQIVTDHDKG